MTESTLTCPSDRVRENKWKVNSSAEPLTKEECKHAYEDLIDGNFIKKYRVEDRKFSDPFPPMQKYCLVSFSPAQGATPNDNGIYGMAKFRGSYESLDKAKERAEFLIRYVDSTHPIRIGYVGSPFPITSSSDYSSEIDEIDLNKEISKVESEERKNIKMKEYKEMKEIKSREENILKTNEEILSGKYEIDPYDTYIELRVKKAQQIFNLLEYTKKIEEYKTHLVTTIKDVEDLDEKHPTFKHTYFEKYDNARKKSGLDKGKSNENFVRFMVEDVPLPEIEDMFLKKYGRLPRSKEEDEKKDF